MLVTSINSFSLSSILIYYSIYFYCFALSILQILALMEMELDSLD